MGEIKTLTADQYASACMSLRQKRRFPAAIACARRAVELDPAQAAWHFLLGNTLLLNGDYDAAEAALEEAAEIDPKNYSPVHDIGMCCLERGDLPVAISYFRYALKLNPTVPETRMDLALAHLMAGSWRKGFEEYDARMDLLPAQYPQPAEMTPWQGQDLTGKTLFVTAEQGIGDTIMFARFLDWASSQAAKVIFEVQAELFGLFIGYCKICELRAKGSPVPLPKADYWIPLCSLARWSGVTANTVPPDPGFLRSVATMIPVHVPECDWRPQKIGLCWSGNPAHGHDHDRSIALEHFLPLMGERKRQFYSFQVGHRAKDLELAGAQALLYDLSPTLNTWEVTAGSLLKMDVVISADTAIAHLAAAMGVPTCIVVGKVPDWRWGLTGGTTPWYPSAELVRSRGDWVGAIGEIEAILDGERVKA